MTAKKKSAPGGTQICSKFIVPSESHRSKKRHYYILLDGEYVGQTWAVSEAKAVTNYWWKYVKESDPFTVRELDPTDFEAIAH